MQKIKVDFKIFIPFLSITSLSQSITLNETDNAEFRCDVDANPFDDSTVEWDLPDRVYTGSTKWTDRRSIQVSVSLRL